MSVVDDMDNIEPNEEIVEEDGFIIDHEALVDDDLGRYVDNDDDLYGGMEHTLYEAIVEFKKNPDMYPPLADQRLDRSAHCHWRIRCARFLLDNDGETLLYYNQMSTIPDAPKYVVRKNEVKGVVERVHYLIGHLGTKRTQSAVMRKFYWRSVRNDVRTAVNSCEFCNQKKIEGRKLQKAPVDLDNGDYDLEVRIDNLSSGRTIDIFLPGIDDEYLKAAMTRVTPYTFGGVTTTPSGVVAPMDQRTKREREEQHYIKRPYVRRTRVDGHAVGYIVPMEAENGDSSYMEIPHARMTAMMRAASENAWNRRATTGGDASRKMLEEEGEAFEQEQLKPPLLPSHLHQRSIESSGSGSYHHPQYAHQHQPRFGRRKRKIGSATSSSEAVQASGAAARLIAAVGCREDVPSPSTSKLEEQRRVEARRRVEGEDDDVERVLVGEQSVHEARERPELGRLPPVALIPSADPEVTAMQKELLRQQLEIQKLQMQVLRARCAEMEGYVEVAVDDDESRQRHETQAQEDVEEVEEEVLDVFS